jgi:hypothetical protein
VVEGELLGEGAQASLLATDLLELAGHDLGGLPYRERRRRLSELLAAQEGGGITCAPLRTVGSWSQLDTLWQELRADGATALMLRQLDSSRDRTACRLLRYRPPAASIVAVLLYARLDGPAPELTFGVRDDGRLNDRERRRSRLVSRCCADPGSPSANCMDIWNRQLHYH